MFHSYCLRFRTNFQEFNLQRKCKYCLWEALLQVLSTPRKYTLNDTLCSHQWQNAIEKNDFFFFAIEIKWGWHKENVYSLANVWDFAMFSCCQHKMMQFLVSSSNVYCNYLQGKILHLSFHIIAFQLGDILYRPLCNNLCKKYYTVQQMLCTCYILECDECSSHAEESFLSMARTKVSRHMVWS